MKKEIFALRLNMRHYVLMVWLCLMISCQKTGDGPSIDSANENGDVAIGWYKLQLKIVLNATPAISPPMVSRIFGYVGIGLFESARCGLTNSVSLSTYLYQMPAMPAMEKKRCSGSISANAALANLVKVMYP